MREEAPADLPRDPALSEGVVARLWDKYGPWEVDGRGYPQGQVLIDEQRKRLVITESGFEKVVEQLGVSLLKSFSPLPVGCRCTSDGVTSLICSEAGIRVFGRHSRRACAGGG